MRPLRDVPAFRDDPSALDDAPRDPTIVFQPEAALPRQAWACDLSGGTVTVRHGSAVEVAGDRFFEGAWDGPFAAMEFDRAAEVFGSGCVIGPESILVVPPSHTLEPVYILDHGGGRTISNSLSFALARGDAGIDPADWRYGARFADIVRGIDRTPATVPVIGGKLTICHVVNVALARRGDGLQARRKNRPPRFPDFDAYAAHLRRVTASVCANAADPARRSRYVPLTTVSTGYDSPACAVLARAAGCRRALTFTTARGGAPDSGAAIARRLGLEPVEIPRSEVVDAEDEVLMVSTGMHGEDIVYAAAARVLPGAVLFTGFHGDKVWDRLVPANAVIKRGDISGSGLGELRLELGFIHLPVPFIGCLNHADIRRISNDPAMRPWSVGGSYDRPIPRRIAEEAGIERQSFGITKKAVSSGLFRQGRLAAPAAAAAAAAVRNRARIGARIAYRRAALRFHAGMAAYYGLKVAERAARLVRGDRAAGDALARFKALTGVDFSVFEHTHPNNTAAFAWATAMRKQRYRAPAPDGAAPQGTRP